MISFYLMLTLAVLILAAMMWRYDRHKREHWLLLLLALVLGAFARPCIGSFNDWLLLRVGSDSTMLMATLAGSGEESIKVIVVLLIALAFRNHFDDPMDGIVYGAFAGLGFALSESSFYIPDTLHMFPKMTHRELFGQEATRAVLHFLTGGIAGFGLGLARCRVAGWQTLFFTWFSAAMLIHFTWDYACGLSTADDTAGEIFQRSAAVGLMIAAMILFRIAISVSRRWSLALAGTVHGTASKNAL